MTQKKADQYQQNLETIAEAIQEHGKKMHELVSTMRPVYGDNLAPNLQTSLKLLPIQKDAEIDALFANNSIPGIDNMMATLYKDSVIAGLNPSTDIERQNYEAFFDNCADLERRRFAQIDRGSFFSNMRLRALITGRYEISKECFLRELISGLNPEPDADMTVADVIGAGLTEDVKIPRSAKSSVLETVYETDKARMSPRRIRSAGDLFTKTYSTFCMWFAKAQGFDMTGTPVAYLTPNGSTRFDETVSEEGAGRVSDEMRCIERIIAEEFSGVEKPGEDMYLVDLGCGNGKKALSVLRKLSGWFNLSYVGVDISPKAADKAQRVISENGFPAECVVQDINELDISRYEGKKLIVFYGNTLCNMPDIKKTLKVIGGNMTPDDLLMVGVELKGDLEEMLKFYNNDQNARFILDLAYTVGFRPDEVSYRAEFTKDDDILGAVSILKPVTICHGEQQFRFLEGDQLLVLKSHKPGGNELSDTFRETDYDAQFVTDNGYVVVKARKMEGDAQ